jgi:acetoin utilization deacetylase AcuC-like enzyme
MSLPIIHSETYKLHNPTFEIWPGGWIREYFESPQRVEIILSALKSTGWAEVRSPGETSIDPIAAVHDRKYMEYLQHGYRHWLETNPETMKDHAPTYYATTFPPPRSQRRGEQYGNYTFDQSAPLVEGTYQSILGSAQCAITAANLILNKQRAAYALCRPPGHHAGKDFSGGYCYFNNTAIAAKMLSAKGRVTILDVDYHHGNGTQDIFYDDDHVLTISIHGDPSWEYPYFLGYADEVGSGKGEGFNLNIPLPKRTDGMMYFAALDQAIKRIIEFKPWAMVVALGFDTFDGDPISQFVLKTEEYTAMAQRIRLINVPTVIVQEGGYNTGALGWNAVAFLKPFAE